MTPEATFTCCITFDFDATSSWIGSARSNNPSMISRGEFGAAAIPRILALLKRFAVQASFAVPGHTAYAYPGLVEMIVDHEHEIVHHGWVHENPARLDESQERRVLERGLHALERVAGTRPRGYRSPAWDFSLRSIALLHEYGFDYDSSCMGHDHYPYYLRVGDKWSTDGPYHFGETIDLVELPVYWGLDDFPLSEYVPGFNEGMRPPAELEALWRDDFDYARAHAPQGVFTLTLHPQVIGRGNRMMLLERLLEYFTSRNVQFSSMSNYVAGWRAHNALADWVAANPDRIGVRAITDD